MLSKKGGVIGRCWVRPTILKTYQAYINQCTIHVTKLHMLMVGWGKMGGAKVR